MKSFPKDTDHSEIVEFLISSGLQPVHMDNIQIKGNGSVTVSGLDSSECKILIDSIHHTFFSGKKLYCNGIVPLTPEKQAATTPSSPSACLASAPTTGPPQSHPASPTPLGPAISAALSTSPLVLSPGQPTVTCAASATQPQSSSGSPNLPDTMIRETVIAQ